KLSLKASLKIIDALKLSPKEAEYFQTLVRLESAESPEVKLSLAKKLESIFPQKRSANLSLDAFRTISDWYHIATVELANLDEGNLSVETMTKSFGISRFEALAAIDRLERLELIKKSKSGKYVKVTDNPVLSS